MSVLLTTVNPTTGASKSDTQQISGQQGGDTPCPHRDGASKGGGGGVSHHVSTQAGGDLGGALMSSRGWEVLGGE